MLRKLKSLFGFKIEEKTLEERLFSNIFSQNQNKYFEWSHKNSHKKAPGEKPEPFFIIASSR